MALSHRPLAQSRPVRAVSRSVVVARILVAALVAPLAYVSLGGVLDPSSVAELDPQHIQTAKPQIAEASLSFSGATPVIKGSVASLFKTATFSGITRADKTDRVRPQVDAASISKSFDEARIKLAALRAPADAAALGQSSVADAGAKPDADNSPRMSVASLDPKAAAALDAIAGIAPSTGALVDVTMPDTMPDQLAYARASGVPSTNDLLEQPPATQTAYSDKELWCLANAVYFEARGESYRGQVAVAQVVMNRVKDYRYPKTICGVVYQNQQKRNACQFSFACDGIPEVVTEEKPWEQAQDIAKQVASGDLYLTEVGTATHYHATYVRPAWAPRMEKVTQIGLHVFYKFKNGWLFG